MAAIRVLGIDLGKSSFHVVGHNEHGRIIFKKRFSRQALLTYLQQLPICTVAMESCPGSQWLGRYSQSLGHDARLLPAQYVKPYVKTNKNDFIDADAIAEAAIRPTMRFVPIKSEHQQAALTTHRLRDGFIKQRNACMSQIHAFLLEFGIDNGKGHSAIRRLPAVIEQQHEKLPHELKQVLEQLYQHYHHLSEQIDVLDKRIKQAAIEDESSKRLMTIPGIGIHTATRLMAEIGNASRFASGRELAAWMGLTPRQYSTGGKQKLLGISKRGNKHLRCLFIHCARSVLRFAHKYCDKAFGQWIANLTVSKPFNVATVALANKLVRIAWALLTKRSEFQLT